VRSPAERLRDILEAIERIERYTAQGRAAFDSDEQLAKAGAQVDVREYVAA